MEQQLASKATLRSLERDSRVYRKRPQTSINGSQLYQFTTWLQLSLLGPPTSKQPADRGLGCKQPRLQAGVG